MNKKNICMFWAFSWNNRWDFAILETIVNNINEFSENIYISSKKPKIIQKELKNIKNVNVFKTYTSYIWINSIKYIYKSDIVTIWWWWLIFERNFFNIFFNHLIWIFFVVFISKLLKKDIYIFSVWVEKITKKIPKIILKYILKNPTKISVRDQNSLKIVKNIYSRDYLIFNDPVLSINIKNNDINKKWAVIIINKSTLNDKWLIKLIDLLNKLNIRVTIFENERTQNLVKNFIKENNLDNKVSYIKEDLIDTKKIIAFLSGFEITITAPMHWAIFSYLWKTPVMCISWNEKVKSFLDIVDNDFLVFNSFWDIREKDILLTIWNNIDKNKFKKVQKKSQEWLDYFIKNFLK